MNTIQDVIDLLRKPGPIDVPDPAWRFYRMEKAATMLQEIADKQPRWISVKERLPEKYTTVNVISGGVVGSGRLVEYNGKPFWDVFSHGIVLGIKHVTHWQPLPEPPEAE